MDHDHEADDHFGMSAETLQSFDDMLGADMQLYVEETMKGASPEVEAALERAYMGVRVPVYRHATGPNVRFTDQKGGDSEATARMNQTLELHDTLHDADCERSEESMEYVAEVITGSRTPELPRPMAADATVSPMITLAQVANHDAFVDVMTRTPFVQVFGTRLDNPLSNKDYRPEFAPRPVVPDVPDAGKEAIMSGFETACTACARVHDARVKRPNFDGVEIWTTESMNTSRSKVFRVAEFCRTVRDMFSRRAKFMMDVPDALVQLLLKYKEADGVLGRKYLIVNPAIGDLEHVVNLQTVNEWTLVKCDASLLDPGDHPGQRDKRETGVVSLQGSRVFVEMFGLPDMNGAEYVADSTEFKDEHYGTRKYVVNGRWLKDPALDMGPEKYTQGGVQALAAARPRDDIGREARYFAMKRSGDWGQVEHCKKYGMVFVTHDKPAFLYALAREVSSMLMIVDGRYGEYGCLGYSFVMYAPPGAAQALYNSKPIELPSSKKRAHQRGGGRNSILAVVAAATTIVASVLASIHATC